MPAPPDRGRVTRERQDPGRHRRRHRRDAGAPRQAALVRDATSRSSASAASGEEAVEIAARLHAGRRAHGHQHAGHGRHRHDRAALGARCPTAAIVMMSVQGEADYLRRSMLAGAREFLVKPFSSDELCGVDPPGPLPASARSSGRMVVACPSSTSRGRRAPASARPAGSSRCSRPRAGSGARRSPSTSRSPWPASRAARWRSWTAASSSATWACCSTSTPRTSRSSTSLGDARQRRRRPRRQRAHQPQHGHPGAAGAAQPGDGGAGHGRAHPPHVEPPARRPTTSSSSTAGRSSRTSTLALLDMSDLILGVLTLEITNIKNIRLFLEVAEQLGYAGDKLAPRAQPRRLGVRHPRRRRGELHRPQDRPHGRLRRPDGRVRAQPRRAVRVEQQAGPGEPGRPRASLARSPATPRWPPTRRRRTAAANASPCSHGADDGRARQPYRREMTRCRC